MTSFINNNNLDPNYLAGSHEDIVNPISGGDDEIDVSGINSNRYTVKNKPFIDSVSINIPQINTNTFVNNSILTNANLNIGSIPLPSGFSSPQTINCRIVGQGMAFPFYPYQEGGVKIYDVYNNLILTNEIAANRDGLGNFDISLSQSVNLTPLQFPLRVEEYSPYLGWTINNITATVNINFNRIEETFNLNVNGSLLRTDASNNRIGINLPSPQYELDVSGTIEANNFIIPRTGTFSLFNTDSQTTNFERILMNFNSNIAQIYTNATGTGLPRTLRCGVGGITTPNTYLEINDVGSLTRGFFQFFRSTSSNTPIVTFTNSALSAATTNQQLMLINPTIQQTNTAGYTLLQVNPTITSEGSGVKRLLDIGRNNSSFFTIDSNSNVDLARNSTFNLYNTTDQTTNLERLSMNFTGNVCNIFTNATGTGIARNLRLGCSAPGQTTPTTFMEIFDSATVGRGFYNFSRGTAGTTPIISFTGLVHSAPGGNQQTLLINPVVHQTGTAGYCALQVDVSYTSVGTGRRYQYQGGINGVYTVNITENGNVGLGTTTPTVQLDLSTDGARKLTTTTWQTGSDERVKENIEDADIDMCYDTIKNLKLKRFKWSDKYYKNVDDRSVVGFIAQEVEKIFPKAVKKNNQEFLIKKKGEEDEDGSILTEDVIETVEDFRSLDIDQINKTLFGALQALMKKVENMISTTQPEGSAQHSVDVSLYQQRIKDLERKLEEETYKNEAQELRLMNIESKMKIIMDKI